MTKEQTIKAIKVMQAFVDGKEVEVNGMPDGSVWMPAGAPCWNWQFMEYRIKPTLTFRPWTADEVPLGAWMRNVPNGEYRWLINTSSLDESRKAWLTECEHSIDGGKTWLPCGVMEEAK
jgi:hypothetical protein